MTINKKISLAIGCIVISVAGGTAITQNMQSQRESYAATIVAPTSSSTAVTTTVPSQTTKSSTGTQAPKQTPTVQTYTLAEVATHGNGTSCWSAINGGVYNLTSWINQHPGGQQAILSICGKDGSAAFNDQHSGQRRPANELVGFKIGVLSSQ